MDPMRATAAVGGLGVAAAATIAVAPSLKFAYPAGLSRVATETALALCAVIAAGLLVGRSRGRRSYAYLCLCAGVVVLAACGALQMVSRIAGGLDAWWAMYAAALAGAVLLAIAARAPDRRAAGWLEIVGLAAGVLAAAVAFVHLIADAPRGLADMAVLNADVPYLDREPGILGVHLACGAAFAVAAAGLARRAGRTGEPLACCLALACALEAVARLCLVLFPPVPNGWLHVADVSRLGFAVLLLVGAVRATSEDVVGGERRRIAHGLHDGVAQELAFIRRHAHGPILEAARRADEQTRRAIDVLSAPPREDPARGVKRGAARAAEREGIALVLVLAPTAEASGEVCEALASIAGEAVANAARHGHAETVRVELSAGDPIRLRIVDDGVGFDPDAPPSGGYGLVSMRERAEEIGARLAVASRPGGGTEVRVELPS
jgi:signal transduction histidine kinase